VKSYEDWFARTWRFVQPALPPAGYDAVGIDPNTPDEPHYEQCEFEKYQAGLRVDAVIACTSLHHVPDLDLALDLVAGTGAGTVVVIECRTRTGRTTSPTWAARPATSRPRSTAASSAR
jgi:hypothetical protein